MSFTRTLACSLGAPLPLAWEGAPPPHRPPIICIPPLPWFIVYPLPPLFHFAPTPPLPPPPFYVCAREARSYGSPPWGALLAARSALLIPSSPPPSLPAVSLLMSGPQPHPLLYPYPTSPLQSSPLYPRPTGLTEAPPKRVSCTRGLLLARERRQRHPPLDWWAGPHCPPSPPPPPLPPNHPAAPPTPKFRTWG